MVYFRELLQTRCIMIFLVMLTSLAIAIYLTIYASHKTHSDNGILESKYSSCHLIINTCKAYFNMYITHEITSKPKYCIITQDNSTYNNYFVNETYKLRNIAISGNSTTCNFGEDNYTDNTIYSIGISLFAFFMIMCCCVHAYIKLKILHKTTSTYPIANVEQCRDTTILVTVTNSDECEYTNFTENQIVASRV